MEGSPPFTRQIFNTKALNDFYCLDDPQGWRLEGNLGANTGTFLYLKVKKCTGDGCKTG